MYTKLIVIIAIFTGLISCKNKENNEYSKTLDSLESVISKTDSIYKIVDWEKGEEVEKTVKADIKIFEEKLKTADLATTQLISFYSLTKMFGENEAAEMQAQTDGSKFEEVENEKFLKKQIDYSFSQLKNLRHDIDEKIMKPEQVKKYLATEADAIGKLYYFTLQKSVIYKYNIAQYDSLKPNVDKLIESLK